MLHQVGKLMELLGGLACIFPVMLIMLSLLHFSALLAFRFKSPFHVVELHIFLRQSYPSQRRQISRWDCIWRSQSRAAVQGTFRSGISLCGQRFYDEWYHRQASMRSLTCVVHNVRFNTRQANLYRRTFSLVLFIIRSSNTWSIPPFNIH